jgi:hypothetical protein
MISAARTAWVMSLAATAALAQPTSSTATLATSGFDGFWQTWQPVTVRYRADIDEQRFVYANELAWAALQQGSHDFPDGAAFAKVGFTTSVDSLFPSSLVPGHAVRYQVMIKDRARYARTRGWGYSLYLENGRPPEEDPATTVAACAACHELAASRGYVFSLPTHAGVGGGATPPTLSAQPALSFETAPALKFPQLQGELPAHSTSVRLVSGALAKTVFAAFGGPVHELQPALAVEAQRSGLPAGAVSDTGTAWVFAFVVPGAAQCKVGPRPGRLMRVRVVDRAASREELKTFCL